MKIVKPSIEFIWMTENPLQTIERAGRTCYKSEDKITEESAPRFVQMLLKRGHEAMIEHASMSYRVITDRGVTHEIVRHRLFSYAQESTRYCNYAGKEIEFIQPMTRMKSQDEDCGWLTWKDVCEYSEIHYNEMIRLGYKPEIARSVLPNSLKTEIVITGNLREWRHFFRLRTAKEAHPQMQEIALMVLNDASMRIPIVFDEFL